MGNITEDEVKNAWVERLKIKKEQDKAVKDALKANKAAGLLKIKNDKVAENPIASPFSENWRYKGDDIDQQWKDTGGWGFGVEDSGQGFFTPLPLVQGQTDNKVVHHLQDHFQDKPLNRIIEEHITGETPLSPEDLERILGPNYEEELKEFKKRQQQKTGSSLKIRTA